MVVKQQRAERREL